MMLMQFADIAVPTLSVIVAMLVVWTSTRRILLLRSKRCPGTRRFAEQLVLWPVTLAAIAVAGNSAYDAIVHLESSPPGAMYLVDGHKMRLDCIGTGDPTIVLDAGLGNDGLIWGSVQSALAKTTRVCSYDRAGFGWSDPLPRPRDADHIAAELHKLLMVAKVEGPTILMGHSISGLYLRDYASRYPAAIVGLIFVDASTPSQNLDPIGTSAYPEQPVSIGLLQRAGFYLGLNRLFGACPGSFPGYSATANPGRPVVNAIRTSRALASPSGEAVSWLQKRSRK
jgi:pimeloyl-ACP methyl ester carboxylesterase